MFRKFSLKTLSIVFIALLALVIIARIVDHSNGTNTLKSMLFDVNTDNVTSVVIYPKMLKGDKIELKKAGDNWTVLRNGNTYNGEGTMINRLIDQVNKLKPLRLAARKTDQWEKYELTDSLSSVVKLMNGSKELASLYIGKFSYRQAKQNPAMMQQNQYYQQPRGTMTTYVRTGDDDEVYAVEGFLGSMINRDANAFRNKQLVKVNKTNLNKISFNYPADSSFTMVLNEDKWMSDGIALDSASVAQYLNKIQNLKASAFADVDKGNYTHTIQIQDNQMNIAEVKAYLDGDEAVMVSNQNEGTIFKEKKDMNFSKLFVSKSAFIK
ncbi:DUF4340 domain-containing protein [Plebeiibacterium sediminum]|uniref:DUF4340 domain-containing protein n=1 Tax=Plebeiibacterium sediminum TaxID=2992112 RepID=A0AAE3SH80_9BACT|nr:DUF4340 domain-containing protein [Plebeiobacterium sediminum]MCW3789268.1 DUF4340 domain-containing protein [Plebeiobacterium sediminum]